MPPQWAEFLDQPDELILEALRLLADDNPFLHLRNVRLVNKRVAGIARSISFGTIQARTPPALPHAPVGRALQQWAVTIARAPPVLPSIASRLTILTVSGRTLDAATRDNECWTMTPGDVVLVCSVARSLTFITLSHVIVAPAAVNPGATQHPSVTSLRFNNVWVRGPQRFPATFTSRFPRLRTLEVTPARATYRPQDFALDPAEPYPAISHFISAPSHPCPLDLLEHLIVRLAPSLTELTLGSTAWVGRYNPPVEAFVQPMANLLLLATLRVVFPFTTLPYAAMPTAMWHTANSMIRGAPLSVRELDFTFDGGCWDHQAAGDHINAISADDVATLADAARARGVATVKLTLLASPKSAMPSWNLVMARSPRWRIFRPPAPYILQVQRCRVGEESNFVFPNMTVGARIFKERADDWASRLASTAEYEAELAATGQEVHVEHVL